MYKKLVMDKPSQKIGPKRKFVYYHLPVILFAGAIITVSSIPYMQTPEFKLIAVDKLGHFLEYAIFAFLTFRSFSNFRENMSGNLAYVMSLLFLGLFAILDEYYQSFIPGRFSDVADFMVDISGSFLVVTFFWLRYRRLKESTD